MGVQFSVKNSYPPVQARESFELSLGTQEYFEKEARTHDMRVKVIPESHVDRLLYLRPEWRCDFRDRVRPDTSLER